MRWMPSLRIVTCIALAVTSGVVSGTASGAILPRGEGASTASVYSAGQRYGFNDNGLFNHEIPRGVFLDKLQNSGATYLRSGISWQYYERQRGVYDEAFWSSSDRNYVDLLARGIQPIITLIGTPYWALTTEGRGARSPDGQFRCDNSTAPCVAPPDIDRTEVRSAWQSFVRKAVIRYPNAAAIEVWNEPNIRWFWLQSQNPPLYARLLAATAQAVHQANPSMVVLSGGLANYDGSNTTANTAADSFLSTIYSVAGTSAFDAIGWHTYPCNIQGRPPIAQVQFDLQRMRVTRHEAGDDTTPLWLTEIGATTSGGSTANCGGGEFSESRQATVLGNALDWLKSENAQQHDLPVVLVHSLMNTASRSVINVQNSDGQTEYGLVAYSYKATTRRTTISDKPAYGTVRCKMRSTC